MGICKLLAASVINGTSSSSYLFSIAAGYLDLNCLSLFSFSLPTTLPLATTQTLILDFFNCSQEAVYFYLRTPGGLNSQWRLLLSQDSPLPICDTRFGVILVDTTTLHVVVCTPPPIHPYPAYNRHLMAVIGFEQMCLLGLLHHCSLNSKLLNVSMEEKE